jgi:hypothetical protein
MANWTILKKNFTDFFVKKVRSGSGTIIQDPDTTWPKSFRSDRIRIHNAAANCLGDTSIHTKQVEVPVPSMSMYDTLFKEGIPFPKTI